MNRNIDLSDQKFLIVGGTSRAGTTAVFRYLGNHPQIRPSSAKESRFFLDADYPLPSKIRYHRDELQAYLSLFNFKGCQSKDIWRFEATPDYLYSPGTPRRIRETLPNVRFIFLLREPVSRLLSFYQFGRAMNEIPLSMTFDQYIQVQRTAVDSTCLVTYQQHPSFHALQHGRYSVYLKPFVELFGRSSIYVTFQEQLRSNPLHLVRGICQFAAIDAKYYENYCFKVANKSVQVRNPFLHTAYILMKQRLRAVLGGSPNARRVLGPLGRSVNALYRKMNWKQGQEIIMSPSTQEFIFSYYEKEAVQLRQILGIEVPWGGIQQG